MTASPHPSGHTKSPPVRASTFDPMLTRCSEFSEAHSLHHGSVDVAIILFRSSGTIASALRSLPRGARIWLVENLPDDGSVEAALDACPDACILRPNTNLGFGAACNLAIAQGSAPFILLLNPDARLEPGCLDRMLLEMESNPNTAAVGPLVLQSRDGLIDSAGLKVRAPGWTFDRMRGRPKKEAPPTGFVEALSGGVLLLRRSALVDIGRHPEAFWGDLFLYSEDVDLSIALRRGGWSLLYLQEALAYHDVGGSSPPQDFVRALACRNRIVTGLVHTETMAFFSPINWALWSWRACMDCVRILNNFRIPELRRALPGLLFQVRSRRRQLTLLSMSRRQQDKLRQDSATSR
jgi:N-acetylglucosaminyl-diphospho-decaprenol L-rhamnosyltransferase